MTTEGRPRPRRRRWVGLTALVVLAALGWVGLQAWLVADDLRTARAIASEVATDLQAGDTAGLESQVDTLREHASDAADRTDSLTWRALSGLPVVGDDAEAVARVSTALDLVAEQSLAPLVATGLDPEAFTPRQGRVPLQPIEQLSDPLAQASAGLAEARAELELTDTDGLLAAIREPYEDALTEVTRADRAVGAASTGAELLPGMLGADERRTYLVVFQNSAEVRSLGGMPGIVATLTAENGRLTMGETIPISSFGQRERPVLPLTDEEKAVWGDQPGTWFQDAVFIPDFPRASELMAGRFADETDQQVDGVLSVDPAAMSYVVGATGGVTVDGVALTEENFVDELVHKSYLRFVGDSEAEDAFFASVATTVFEDALAGGAGAKPLIDALSRGVDEGRVLLHSFNEQEQAELAGMRIAGELPSDGDGPLHVGIYANDSTGSKMSYFLRHDAAVEVSSCQDGATQLAGRLAVRSDTPKGVASLPETITGSGAYGVPRGVQLVTFTLVGPVGGETADVEIDGEPTEEELATYRGRPVAKVPLWLEPEAQLEVTWRMDAPRSMDELELRTTPGTKGGGEIGHVTLKCGSR